MGPTSGKCSCVDAGADGTTAAGLARPEVYDVAAGPGGIVLEKRGEVVVISRGRMPKKTGAATICHCR